MFISTFMLSKERECNKEESLYHQDMKSVFNYETHLLVVNVHMISRCAHTYLYKKFCYIFKWYVKLFVLISVTNSYNNVLFDSVEITHTPKLIRFLKPKKQQNLKLPSFHIFQIETSIYQNQVVKLNDSKLRRKYFDDIQDN